MMPPGFRIKTPIMAQAKTLFVSMVAGGNLFADKGFLKLVGLIWVDIFK